MPFEFFYGYIFLLLILFSLSSSKENIIILKQYEYELNIYKYNLTILNLNIDMYNMKYSLLAYINNTNFDFENIFSYYTPYYNHFWLFFISDINVFNKIISKYKSTNDYMTIYGIIVPKILKNELPKSFPKSSPSIFFIDNNFTINLEESDFRNHDKIVYYSFDTLMPINHYPEIYILTTSLLIFLISFIVLLFWNIYYRITKDENLTDVQKYCNSLPYLNIISTILLLIKCLYIKGKDPFLHYDYMFSVDTLFISMNSIKKIVLWYFLLMISTGWKIAIQTLSKKIKIFYLKMIIFIFITICSDIAIYNISESSYKDFGEIKDIGFYVIMSIIILKEIKKTLKLLFKKLHYAETLIPEFIEGLLFKIKIFHQLKNLIISYPIIFIIIFVIHIFLPFKYDTICSKFIDYYFDDIYFLINLLIIFAPQELPPNYDVDFAKDIENDPGKIYKLTIQSNNDGTIEFNPLDKKEIMKIKQKKLPIIIFGPNLSDDNNLSYNKYNFFINNSNEKEISKLYSTLELGFSE